MNSGRWMVEAAAEIDAHRWIGKFGPTGPEHVTASTE